ncbi:hypothetical protein ODS41_02705 [Pyrobaculum sp. 3827-6]|uniref:hypothetical protein n=1 Tax=Pyrobaculum sp. 3827-6 TaxID=2983604 RepID=UPI0021D8ADFF|nr:hypothetical protein [Pyrobaculum sp. 3827-6]MCU7786839.1 hypothetical protein [Pyrobaculum sp. 3827-6]
MARSATAAAEVAGWRCASWWEVSASWPPTGGPLPRDVAADLALGGGVEHVEGCVERRGSYLLPALSSALRGGLCPMGVVFK